MLSRRQFHMITLAAVGTLCCQRPAFSAFEPKGCWLSSASGAKGGIGKLLGSSGNSAIDDFVRKERENLNRLFGVTPSLFFFSGKNSENAFASPEVIDAKYPDGFVLLGVGLMEELWGKYRASNALPLAAVMAHEWGHILQFKKGIHSDWQVNNELGADRASGWYLSTSRGLKTVKRHSKPLSNFFASLGSRHFNNFKFHGTPTQRSNEFLHASGLLYGSAENEPEKAIHDSAENALRHIIN